MGTDNLFEPLRRQLMSEVAAQLTVLGAQLGCRMLSERVMQAMERVPRHEFVPAEVKPFAYMNVAGPVVARLLRLLDLTPAALIVVHDDLDLPYGRVRIRHRGRSGGHNGVQSLIGALGTGLLISTIAETQQIAFQIALLVSLLPTIMLSGFIFPISSMPRALQLVTNVVPARYFLVALRGVVLKGTELTGIIPQLAALLVYAAVVLGLASVRLARERA